MTLLEAKTKIRDEFMGENGIHGVGIGDNVIHLFYEEIKSGCPGRAEQFLALMSIDAMADPYRVQRNEGPMPRAYDHDEDV
jgi:hypothetical protein